MGSTIAALRATVSIEEADAKAKNNRDNSFVNFPALPVGTLKLFILQCQVCSLVGRSGAAVDVVGIK